jgi:hypothetical protein
MLKRKAFPLGLIAVVASHGLILRVNLEISL